MSHQQLENETRSTCNEQAVGSLSYVEGTYVAVLSDDKSYPFWIAQVHSSELTFSKTVHFLMVHWLQVKGSIFDSAYTLAFLTTTKKKSMAWHGIDLQYSSKL